MARYIDAEAFKKRLIEKGFYPAIVARALEDMPSADVVEIVRCIDCKHSSHFKCCSIDKYKCKKIVTNPLFNADFFCKYGERKDDASRTPKERGEEE